MFGAVAIRDSGIKRTRLEAGFMATEIADCH
jgi:hypothetical protein